MIESLLRVGFVVVGDVHSLVLHVEPTRRDLFVARFFVRLGCLCWLLQSDRALPHLLLYDLFEVLLVSVRFEGVALEIPYFLILFHQLQRLVEVSLGSLFSRCLNRRLLASHTFRPDKLLLLLENTFSAVVSGVVLNIREVILILSLNNMPVILFLRLRKRLDFLGEVVRQRFLFVTEIIIQTFALAENRLVEFDLLGAAGESTALRLQVRLEVYIASWIIFR